jgi:outer membrane receptor protein involved in Fe transport
MKLKWLCLLCFLLTSSFVRLLAQGGATGTILGTVTDTSGAIVQNAQVTVTNVGTGQSYKTTTTSAGDYNAPSLNPGSYSLTIQAPGFSKAQTDQFVLAVDQQVRVNVTMKLGAVNTETLVTAQAVTLDTDSSALSQLVSEAQVKELPLNGRNFMQLLTLGAGAVTVGGEQGTMRQGVGNAVSINGGRPEGNNYTLDGLINTDQALVTPAVILSQDAIQEFKVESGTYSAEYGFGASQINLISKSGTNKLHGTAFETFRNDYLDAKPFATATDYSAATPTANPSLRQNQFGFVADGPVYIPKIYDGRDKTFFMANYEGWRINNGAREQATLPNPAVLLGDFSNETYPAITVGTTNLPGGLLPAYGTETCTLLRSVGRNCMPINPLTGQSYPGNKIPSSLFTSRFANTVIKYGYFETPTIPNQPEGVTNFIQNVGLPLTTNQQTYRVDQALPKRLGQVFGRFTYSKYQNSALDSATLDYGILTQYETQKNWAVSHTISLGKASVNNFRFGYLDSMAPQGAPAPPAAAVAELGETGVFQKFSPLQQSWSTLGLSTYSGTGGPGNAYTGSDNPSWEFADSFSTIHGRHTLQLGVDYRRWRLIRNLDDDFYGDFNFSSANFKTNNINCPNAPVADLEKPGSTFSFCGTGNAVGDLLLGYYSGAAGYVPGPLSPTNTAGNPQTHVFSYFAPYVQDDFKATPKLTLNAGLRWDFRAAPYEVQNHFFWLDSTNAQGGLCYADKTLSTNGVAPGVGVDGVSPILRYCGKVPRPGSKTPFAPRLGFAYRVNEKTVVRGGYGIFFDSFEGREIDDSGDIYPYSIRNNLTPAATPSVTKLTNNLFPSYGKLGPFPVSTLSFIAVIQSENPHNPYIQSRTLSVERELAKNTTLEVNYIGTKGTHLLDRQNIAQPLGIPAADLAFCQANPGATTNNCPTSSRLPYPNFTGDYIDSVFGGYSDYNAMNVKFEHRAADLAITGIYTYAKSLDDKSAAAGVGATGSGYQGFEDNHNPNRDYGPSDFDVNHRFVASYVYQLPVGRGKKFLGGVNRAEDIAVGGWQLVGITTFQTGFPFAIGATDTNGLLGTVNQRANIVPGCNIHANLTKLFQRLNPACYQQPAIGVYGNSGRGILRQPGINNWDMGASKFFDITERAKFQFKFDTFNTFNHHQYDVNVGGLATGGSGGGSSIDNGVGDALFGQITASSPARILQLSGKIIF